MPWALTFLIIEYTAAILVADERGVLNSIAPMYGAGVLIVAELFYWSVTLGSGGSIHSDGLARLLAALSVLLVVSVALGTALLLMTQASFASSPVWYMLALTGTVCLFSLVAGLARNGTRSRTPPP
jgi:hypothetical protein